MRAHWRLRTDNERNHGCAITAGGFEAFDQLLDLPDLDVLLRIVGLRLLGRHGCGCTEDGEGVRVCLERGATLIFSLPGGGAGVKRKAARPVQNARADFQRREGIWKAVAGVVKEKQKVRRQTHRNCAWLGRL